MNKPLTANSFFVAAMLSLFALTSVLSAQGGPFSAPNQRDPLNDPLGSFNIDGPASDDSEKVTVSAEFKVEPDSRNGKVFITARIADGWHIYSLHNSGYSMSTTLKIDKNPAIKTSGNFRPLTRPAIHLVDGLPVYDESHEKEVVWVAPFQVNKDVDAKKLEIEIKTSGQVCKNSCIQFSADATARYAGEIESGELTIKPHVSTPTFGGPAADPVTNPVQLTGEFKLEDGKREGWLIVDAKIASGFHTYTQHNTSGAVPTAITLGDKTGLDAVGNFAPSIEPHVYFNPYFEEFEESFDENFRWIALIKLADETDPNSLKFDIDYKGQACFAGGCEEIETTIPVKFTGFADAGEIEPSPPTSHKEESHSNDTETSREADSETAQDNETPLLDLNALDPEGVDTNEHSFVGILLLALMGGFILNFMPCVLPVIGLKVMSFVNQAGSNRLQALTLNLWYVAGMMSVFLLLATFAVAFSYRWGDQSQSATFNIVMATVVFAMGLSFLGVWEIPIPGFVGTGKAAQAAQKEGPAAAFIKGIITTILAIPCSGPGLATALAYSASDKPAWVVYAIFACLGLGMAFPYIVIGIKPNLVKFLPKPGAWMDTFKQVMGFFLLGTVVFVMSYISLEMRLATLAFLIGIWFCCWLVGRIPIAADLDVKLRNWVVAGTFGVIFGFVSFALIAPMSEKRIDNRITREIEKLRTKAVENGADSTAVEPELTTADLRNRDVDADELHWQPYSTRRLIDETAKSATVLVDFTADS